MIATINNVEIIRGAAAGQGWGRPMQKITTTEGIYMDNDVGVKGSFWRAPDYSDMIGDEVEFTPVNDDNIDEAAAGDRGYFQWIRLGQFD